MAGSVTGLHVFAADVGPEPLSLLDGNFNPLATAVNTLSTFSNYYVDSGAVNALAITVNAPQIVSSYTDGLMVQVQVANTTTSTTPTLAINGLGARTLVHADSSALGVGELVAGMRFTAIYDSGLAEFRVISPTAAYTQPTFNATVTINAVAAKQSLIVNSNVGINAIVVTDGTHSGAIVTSSAAGQEFQIGTTTNHGFALYTNGANRMLVSNSGNFTTNAPASGVAHTIVTSGSGNTALQLNAPATNTAGTLLFFDTTNSVTRGFLGSGGVVTGMAVADFAIAPGTSGNVIIGTANGAGVGTKFGPTGGATIVTGGLIVGTPANPGGFIDVGATAPVLRLQASGANGAISELFATNTVVGIDMNFATTAVPFSIRMGGSGGTEAIGISTNRNITLGAPASGATLTTNVLDNTNAVVWNSTTAVNGYYHTFQTNGTIRGYIGMGTALFTGGALTDFGIANASGTMRFSTNSGSTTHLSITGSAATAVIQGFGPVAAALVDMTPDTSTFTGTFVGMTGSPTQTITWFRVGKKVTVQVPGGLAVNSSATSQSITGVPAAIQPATLDGWIPISTIAFEVASSNNFEIKVTHGSGTWTLSKNGSTSGFANGVSGYYTSPFEFSYLLN